MGGGGEGGGGVWGRAMLGWGSEAEGGTVGVCNCLYDGVGRNYETGVG